MTDRQARRKIHHQLIDIEQTPCAKCNATENLIIHRIKPGYMAGKYILKNCQVLCVDCHREAHNHSKFNLSDKVQINGKCPKWLLRQIRHNRKRTITSIYYDSDRQCCYYYLGNNYNGNSDYIESYPFRSYQLHHVVNRGPGRPRQKRKYTRHNVNTKCTVKSLSEKIERETGKEVVNH